MASPDGFDTRFSLPAVDDPPLTEIGVMLLGLDAERLLAGLGLATPTDDPAQVALAVDRVRHDAEPGVWLDDLVAAGSERWRAARRQLDATGWRPSTSGSLRQAWAHTLQLLGGVELGVTGPAILAYLAACWLRRAAVDGRATDPPTS
jgi:Family of unknown function (DUF6187)